MTESDPKSDPEAAAAVRPPAQAEVHEVAVDLASLPDFSDDGLPDLSPGTSSRTGELPDLDPEQELRVEIEVSEPEHELPEELPVLGPEHEVHDDEPEALPELGPEHEVHDDEPEALPAVPPDTELVTESEPPELEELEASRNYRQVYETKFRGLERDARVAAAQSAEGAELRALCLDPEPQVVRAVLENALAGPDHARDIARHHRTAAGLECVVKRAEWLRDTQVQRLLVRNPQLDASLLGRTLAGKPLAELYKPCLDRDVPEKNRIACRALLRNRWSSSGSDERASFVIQTEARCLSLLVGQTFDSRMTTLLCGRPYNSVLFIQNLARFPACPPALLTHLLKQPFVRKHAALKKLLFQHPNLPSAAKRGG